MKSKAAAWTLVTSTFCALVLCFFANHSFGQGRPVVEETHPQDFIPTLGQRGPTDQGPTPTTHHDITETHGETDLGTPEESPSGDTQTLYDKNAGQKEAANGFQAEHRGRITHGKRQEQIVVSHSDKPVKIQPTKDGSSDASVGTGRFKDSLLDIAVAGGPQIDPDAAQTPAAQKPVQQKQQKHPTARSLKPTSSASPEVVNHLPEQLHDNTRFGLDMDGAVSSQPSPSASPAPQ
jgi:hypothetical protein